jgi:hypothetical protein
MNTATKLLALLLLTLAAVSARALDTGLKPGMDKEREALIAQWRKTLDTGDQAAIEKTLAAAQAKAGVAFGMSDWPQAVAQAAQRHGPPLNEMLLKHLRSNRHLINEATRESINTLFKHDVLDPAGEQVRNWVKFGEPGVKDAAVMLAKAVEAGRWDEVCDYLDAMARVGNDRFLPVAAACLGSENDKVSQAALNVFRAHAKDLGPDLRSPKLCRIWWLQSGKAAFGK